MFRIRRRIQLNLEAVGLPLRQFINQSIFFFFHVYKLDITMYFKNFNSHKPREMLNEIQFLIFKTDFFLQIPISRVFIRYDRCVPWPSDVYELFRFMF